jgi:hydroxycarboxylate dehydrogenase B
MRVNSDELTAFVAAAFVAVAVPRESAQIVARSLVQADLCGHESHGVRQVSGYVKAVVAGHVERHPTITTTVDLGAMMALDGGSTFGQVVVRHLVPLVVERVRRHGVCVAAVSNCGHLGRLADMVELLADAGLVSIMVANDGGADQHVAPPGSSLPRLGTNPIAFGAPRSHAPHLIVDLATSAASHGTIEAMKNRGDPIPDALALADGTIRTMAGNKGYALSVMVDVLAGALTGAGVSRTTVPTVSRQGALVIALDPGRLRAADDVIRDIEELSDYLRSTPSDSGEPVDVPGDHAARCANQRLRGGIELPAPVADQLRALAAEYRIDSTIFNPGKPGSAVVAGGAR